MPELPDLQVFSRNLNKSLAGKTVKEVIVVEKKKLNVTVPKFKKAIEGQVIKSVYRDGKELHVAFENGNVLGLHLMLRGQLFIGSGANEQKNTIIELRFTDDSYFAMVDFQKKATPTLDPKPKASPDALSADFNFKFLQQKLSEAKGSIKAFLLDQDKVKGIGNAYSDEILYDCGVSPFSACNKLPEAKIKALIQSVRKVLKEAEKQIEKAQPDIISGEIRDFLVIHNSKKKHSPTGSEIFTASLNSRKTYYTDEQYLYK
ncbi:MAG: DNA-formamidopyrimidine glycosylase [Segetibacter sp.]|nr:DNA-formamidopyrimidine glycosylase [Segetibacter sp.]